MPVRSAAARAGAAVAMAGGTRISLLARRAVSRRATTVRAVNAASPGGAAAIARGHHADARCEPQLSILARLSSDTRAARRVLCGLACTTSDPPES
jgi:hypothetical protein